jgi:hypothetical protein
VADVDFDADIILIREKKRSHKQRTTRHVSLTPFLKGVLRHPPTQQPDCLRIERHLIAAVDDDVVQRRGEGAHRGERGPVELAELQQAAQQLGAQPARRVQEGRHFIAAVEQHLLVGDLLQHLA